MLQAKLGEEGVDAAERVECIFTGMVRGMRKYKYLQS